MPMPLRVRLIAFLSTALPLLTTGLAEAAMVDIGTLGGSFAYAYSANASGEIVGTSHTGTEMRAFLYSGGIMTDLGSIAGPGYGSEAVDINDSSQIVGRTSVLDINGNQTQHAFLYQGGVMTDLGTLGGFESAASGINNSGQVVGYTNLPGNINHAFLYSGGVMIDLGSMQGTSSSFPSYATAINNVGQIAGYGRSNTLEGYTHAFVYSGGVMTDIGTLGGTGSRAVDINDAGQVAGWSATGTTVPVFTHAFLYENGVMTDLGTLGGDNSWATGIDAYGRVVGYSQTAAPGGGNGLTHAFLYADGVMHDIGALDVGISEALGISNNGRIVGYAYTEVSPSILRETGIYYDLCSHDGILDVLEQCDDGNAGDGDGCNSDCRIEPCYACSGEPSSCSALPAGTSCDDELYCNGDDTCDPSGTCLHTGDPCPGTECNTCQEVFDSCADPFGTACVIGGVCGEEVCSGAGACELISLCEGPYGAVSCTDTVDNDGDVIADAADPDCQPLHEGPAGDPTCANTTDDDADGQIDALDRGCQADPPEVCNGFDDDADGTADEGFPDFDADQIADCIDQDEDNDGVLDAQDNCPLASNAAQGDSNLDGSGDACDDNVPDIINVPSNAQIAVDGQFEPGAGEWADVTPVSYMDGAALVYTSLDPDRDAIYVLFDFSLSTNRLAVGDEIGPISFNLGNDAIVDVFIVQGGPDSDATAHPATSTGGAGDSVRMLVNGVPFANSTNCVTGAVDFNSTSSNFLAGHNVAELSVRLHGQPGGCYQPVSSFWSITLPGVQPGGLQRGVEPPTSILVAQSYVNVDPESGETTLAPIGADPAPIDAFQCYSAVDLTDPKFAGTMITLADAFETKSTIVGKPASVCAPTQYDDPVADSTTNLLCYKIKDAKDQSKFAGRSIQIANAFGTLQLEAGKATQLCMPVGMNGEQSLLSTENFKCYKAKDLKNPAFGGADVSLTNRFGNSDTGVLKPAVFCNPVDTGQGVVNDDAHLTCYKIKEAIRFAGAEITSQNALGPLSLELKKSSLLCMPSTMVELP